MVYPLEREQWNIFAQERVGAMCERLQSASTVGFETILKLEKLVGPLT